MQNWELLQAAFAESADDEERAQAWVSLAVEQGRTDELPGAIVDLLESVPNPTADVARVLCAYHLARGNGARAVLQGRKATELEPGATANWRLLAAAGHLAGFSQVRDAALSQAVLRGDAEAAGIARSVSEGDPDAARVLLDVRSLHFEPAQATVAVADDEDRALAEVVEETLQQQDHKEAVLRLAELLERLVPYVPEAEGRPRGVIGWVNRQFDVHLRVPNAILDEACMTLEGRGVAEWDQSSGRLIFKATSPPPSAPRLGDLASRGSVTEETRLVPRSPEPSNPAPDATAATRTLMLDEMEAEPPSSTRSTATLVDTDPQSGVARASTSRRLSAQPGRALAVGENVGDYEVQGKVAEGGMGAVYRVTRHGRTFALKTVRTTRASHRKALDRELALLELVNRVDFFPTIHHHEIDEHGQLFVIMDWIDGQTLDVWVAEHLRDLDAALFLWVMTQLVDRLAYLHTWPETILFRDLKPKNILIEPRSHSVRLVDFGISHLAGDDLVRSGTERYLAPEVYRGKASVQTDLFALGRVGLFLLFGHEDFDAIGHESRPPRMHERGLTSDLVVACLRLADPQPRRRAQDAHEALASLGAALRGESTLATEAPEAITVCKTCRRAPPRDDARFCPSCGASLASNEHAPANSVRLRVQRLPELDPGARSRSRVRAYEDLLWLRASSDLSALRCLPYIQVEPYDYQEQAAREVMVRMRGRALIADDVGLGKTIEAGLVLKELLLRGFARRCLLVAPPGVLLEQLQEEMKAKFDIEFVQYTSNGDGLANRCGPSTVKNHDFVAVSKALISRPSYAPLRDVGWDVVIVDECHHFKNRQTKGWRHLRQISAGARHVLMLSATPFSGDPEELFALYSCIEPGWLGDRIATFRQRYLRRDRSGPWKPTKNLRVRAQQHTIRRRRTDIGGGVAFPGRDAARVPIRMTESERQLHGEALAALAPIENGLTRTLALQQLASSWESLTQGTIASRLPTRLREQLRRIGDAGHPKVRALLQRVLPSLPTEEKVLLFSRFRASQRALAKALQQQGVVAESLADRSPKQRVELVRRFRRDPDLRVLVCGEGAGEGLNLQFCSILVNFDLPWNPMKIEQRIGRIQRLGQRRRRVSVINLVLDGTIEARVLDVLERKLEIFKLFMGETGQILGALLEQRQNQSFEGWIAQCVLTNGQIDERGIRQLEQELTQAQRRSRLAEDEARSIADGFLGISGPTGARNGSRPTLPEIDLSVLEGGGDW